MAATDFVTETQVDDLAAALAAATNETRNRIGDLATLDTTAKTSLVAAVNEALGAVGSGVVNLAFSRDASTATVESDSGSDAVIPAATQALAGILTAADKTRLDNIETTADVTDAANVGSSINGSAAKGAPVSADALALLDSEAGNGLKKVTVNALSNYVVALITDGAPGTLDTLNELAAALGDDPNAITSINTALGNRLRIDVNNQGLTAPQQANGLTNLGIVRSTADFAGDFDTAIGA